MTAIGIWWRGLLRRRYGRVIAAATGIGVAVALLSSIGAFLAGAQASMTERAARSVAVDWQVEVQPGARLAAVMNMVTHTRKVRAAVPVGYADTPGLAATTGDSTQNTGAGKVLGLAPSYRHYFGAELRTLAGQDSGVLLAQQTAANLHARPGEVIQMRRRGRPSVALRVDGVVDLPQADSLFQKVGAPAGAQPSAPPDNVVLLPMDRWHQLFDAVSADGGVSTQLHVRLAHRLPPDPVNAYSLVVGAAHNLEARGSGAALVGDNLATALDAARSDAAYARILFLFLGLPGAVLAALLTYAVIAAGAQRRRAEQALLRARGASVRHVVAIACTEAFTVGVLGCVLGIGAGAAVGALAFGSARFGASTVDALGWAGAAAGGGLVIAALTVVVPAYRDARQASVAAARAVVDRDSRRPWYLRVPLDLALIPSAVLVYLAAGGNHYELVLAPEGVPSISVSYWAFAAPALLWIGGALLALRLANVVLGRGRRLVGAGLRPFAGTLAHTVASSLARRRGMLARSIVLLALAVCFAGSTAVFNATYRAQAEVDAKLTNGADVTVTESPGAGVTPRAAKRLRAIAGVRSVEPLQHRFAYVGADLQDLYGVRPGSISKVTALRDNYFRGGTTGQLMNRLRSAPDSILVSAETMRDFQLHPGDQLNLRLRNGRTKQTVTVPFHYAGVVTEFPTAPKDSFLVANASYIARKSGSDAVGSFLLDTGGQHSAAVADRARHLLGTSATATDLADVRTQVGSSLTSVDLAGLTTVELGFALVLAAGAGGLVLALGLAERRRGFAVARALGATRRQLRVFIAGETSAVIVGGVLAGVALAWWLTQLLVTMLTGVFDPPPTTLAVPWGYLAGLGATLVLALGAATALTGRIAGRDTISAFRDL